MNTSDILNKAADLIEEHGLGHGCQSMLGENGLCLMGAIHAASFGEYSDDYGAAANCPAGRAVYNYLSLPSEDVDAGWIWNDAKWGYETGTGWRVDRPEEVIEVLRATAVIEAARESAPVEVSA